MTKKAIPADGWDGLRFARVLERAELSKRDVARATNVTERQVQRYCVNAVFPPQEWRRDAMRVLKAWGVAVTARECGVVG